MGVIRSVRLGPMHTARATALAVAILGAAVPAGAQQTVAGYTAKYDRLVQIAANEWAFVGNAQIQRGDTSLYADEIDFFEDEDRAVATGNVLLSQGANRIAADSADFDTKNSVGIFYRAYGIASVQPPRRQQPATPGAFTAPQLAGQETDVYFFGDVIEKIGPKKYRITNGGLSTCLQPTPRWNLIAKTIVVNINHYTELSQAVLNVKGVPMLYLPFLYYPTKEGDRATGILVPTYSSSSVLGTGLHNAFFWAIDRSQDLTVQHEWYSKMGQALGGDYRYNWGGGSIGDIQGYFKIPKNNNDPTNPFPPERSYNISGTANQMLPGRMRAQMSVSYFSSLATNQLFNTNIYDASSNQRYYTGNVVGAWRNYSFNGTFTHSEYFYTQTDSQIIGATPKIDITRSERPLFAGSQVYFGATGEFAHLDGEIKSADPNNDVNNGLTRLDFAPQVRYPFKKWPFFTVNSSILFHDTFYSRSYLQPVTANEPAAITDANLNRDYFTVQAQASGPVFSRIFDTPGNGYAEKFKHTIEPVFTASRTTLIPDDIRLRIVNNDSLDYMVGGTTNLMYGLNNTLYAKRKIGQTSQAVPILAVRISQTYYTNSVASQYDTSYTGATAVVPSNFSPILLDVHGDPNTATDVAVRAQFDNRTRNMDYLSVTGRYNWTTRLQTSANYIQTYNENPPPRTKGYSSLGMSVNAHTADNRYGGQYSLLYDALNSTMQQQQITGFYNAQCCGIAFAYYTRPLGFYGQTSNNTFFISITLAGLGTVSPLNGAMGGTGLTGFPR